MKKSNNEKMLFIQNGNFANYNISSIKMQQIVSWMIFETTPYLIKFIQILCVVFVLSLQERDKKKSFRI